MRHRLRAETLDFVDRAPVRVRETVEVAAPPAEVWPAIADAEAWPSWFAGMQEARYTSPPPHGVGSVRVVSVKGLRVEEEVLAFDTDERFAFTVLGANRPGLRAMVEVVTLEPAGAGTRVTYQQAVELAGWLAPLAPLLRRQLQSGLRAGLAGLVRRGPGG